jgi:outer membrane protein
MTVRFFGYCLFLLIIATVPAFGDEESVPVTREAVAEMAVRNNPSVAIEAGRYATRSEEVGVRRATYYPSITFNFQELYLNTPVLGIATPNLEGIAATVFSPTITQEIYDFGRRRNSVQASRLARRAQKWSLDEARLTVAWNAEIAFDRLAMLQHLLSAAKKNEEAAQLQLEQVSQRRTKGLAIRPDVTQSRVYLQNARLAVVQAENGIRKAQADLVYRTGGRKFIPYRAVEEGGMPPVSGTPEDLAKFALEHRPLIRALETTDERKKVEVHQSFDENLPTLSAFANGILIYGVPPSVSGAPAANGLFLPTYQTGVTLSVPIFLGFRIVHQTEALRNAYRTDLAVTRLARLRVERNVRKVWFDLSTQDKTLALDKVRLVNAKANRDLVLKSYRHGLSDSVALIGAQAEYVSAQETLIADRYKDRMIRDELFRQIGVLPNLRAPTGKSGD